MNKKIVFISLSVIGLILFFIFSVLVKKHALEAFDFNTTVRFQDHTPLKLNVLYPTFSFLASIQSMTVLLIVVLLFRRKLNGLFILFIFLGSHAVELFGKIFIHHPPPPFMFYKHVDAASYAFEKSYVQAGSSYPSGHSFRAFFVALIFAYTVYAARKLSMPIKLILIAVAAIFVIFVCVSRVSLGEHWASDVIGGVLFGIGMGFFCLLVIMPKEKTSKPAVEKHTDYKSEKIRETRQKLLKELEKLDKLEEGI